MKRYSLVICAASFSVACGGSQEPQPNHPPPGYQQPPPGYQQPPPGYQQPPPGYQQPPPTAQPAPAPAPAPPAAAPPAAAPPAAAPPDGQPTAIPGVLKHADGSCSITPPAMGGGAPAAPIKGPCPPGL